MATVRWKDKTDIATLAAGDRMPVTDVDDANTDKYTTPAEIATYVIDNGAITAVVDDTTPQLGGNLDLNSFEITGLVIGTNVQAWGPVLDDFNTLGVAASDGQFIVATGAGAFAYESGSTARNSLGLGITDTPEFDGLTISHSTNGITVGSSSDEDVTLLAVDVTGSPAFSWDESSDGFLLNKPIIVSSDGNGDLTHTIAGASVTSDLEVHSEGATDLGGIAIHRHTDANNFGGHLLFLRSDGSHATPGAVDDNDVLGRLIGLGYDGTDYETAAEIRFIIDGTPGSNDMPGEIQFFTNAGSQTLTLRAAIRADGTFEVGGNAVLDAGDLGSTVQAFDADILKADTADTLTAGFAHTVDNDGTQTTGTYTPTETTGNMKRIVNGGAFTLAPPTNDCCIIVQITNDGSAGAITTSGFSAVFGDSFTTTDGDDFICTIIKINGFSSLTVQDVS